MNNLTKEYIEEFLDEFMLIEYNGGDHNITRAHYRETFMSLSQNSLNGKWIMWRQK